MYFKYIFYNFLWYHFLFLLACFIVRKLYINHNLAPDFFESHHEIFSLVSENCNFFLFCNCGEKCISIRDCLCKIPNYFVCKIQDFLTVCLIKIEAFTTNLKRGESGPPHHFFFMYVWMCVHWISIKWEKKYSFEEK